MKKQRIVFYIVLLLALVFSACANEQTEVPDTDVTGTEVSEAEAPNTEMEESLAQAQGGTSEAVPTDSGATTEQKSASAAEQTPKTAQAQDQFKTAPVPEGKPQPVEPQNLTPGKTAYTCTLSVRCDTILDNIGKLDPDKKELVPANGLIFPATVVTFYEGESVFNVLQREMKKAKMHMEFRSTPVYNSAYIRGIHNLYEFDCGEVSGWTYKVNDWFPNYGSSRYQLKDGDVIEWLYTCDLGRDLEGHTLGGWQE